jgi:long-chain acyl-CoA synthetase
MDHRLKPGDDWGLGSVEISKPTVDGESGVRRLHRTQDLLVTQPLESIFTVPDVLDYAVNKHGNRKAYGYRDIVKMVEEEKEVTKTVDGQERKEMKTWKYFQLSDYMYYTFAQIKEHAVEVSGGLLDLGVKKDEIVNIYAPTKSVYLSLFLPPPEYTLFARRVVLLALLRLLLICSDC